MNTDKAPCLDREFALVLHVAQFEFLFHFDAANIENKVHFLVVGGDGIVAREQEAHAVDSAGAYDLDIGGINGAFALGRQLRGVQQLGTQSVIALILAPPLVVIVVVVTVVVGVVSIHRAAAAWARHA